MFMHPIFFYIIIYLLIGAIGMHVSNKKQQKIIQRQRWKKYFTYVIITGIIIISIFLNLFKYAAVIIAAAGLYEIFKANLSVNKTSCKIISIVFYCIAAYGFLFFSFSFTKDFLVFIYLQVLVFDAFCQIIGQLFGRHKLAPKISSSKTIEGLAGGCLFCILTAISTASWVQTTALAAGLLGGLTSLTCFAGDMLGSYFKRLASIKDFSNFLPAQGGFIDRFGSLMITGCTYYFLHTINLIHLTEAMISLRF